MRIQRDLLHMFVCHTVCPAISVAVRTCFVCCVCCGVDNNCCAVRMHRWCEHVLAVKPVAESCVHKALLHGSSKCRHILVKIAHAYAYRSCGSLHDPGWLLLLQLQLLLLLQWLLTPFFTLFVQHVTQQHMSHSSACDTAEPEQERLAWPLLNHERDISKETGVSVTLGSFDVSLCA